MKPTLLILAAGIGSRYGSLKQVDPVGPSGETIMDYSVYDAIRAGFGKVVFVIRKDIEQDFREAFSRKFEDLIGVEYVYQELDVIPAGFDIPGDRVKPWGTGHAVLVAATKIKENFAVINADDFYGHESYMKMSVHLSSTAAVKENEYAMIGYDLENTLSDHGAVSRGICKENENGYLESVTERTRIQRTQGRIAYHEANGNLVFMENNVVVSMNFWGFTTSIFLQLDKLLRKFLDRNIFNPKSEFYLPGALDDLIKQGEAKVKILRTSAPWFGVTYKEDKAGVAECISNLVKDGIYPQALWKNS